MTVKQLIDQLTQCNPEALVVLGITGEGNDYRPLDEVHSDLVSTSFEFASAVEVYEPTDLEENGIDEGDKNVKPCITLYPI